MKNIKIILPKPQEGEKKVISRGLGYSFVSDEPVLHYHIVIQVNDNGVQHTQYPVTYEFSESERNRVVKDLKQMFETANQPYVVEDLRHNRRYNKLGRHQPRPPGNDDVEIKLPKGFIRGTKKMLTIELSDEEIICNKVVKETNDLHRRGYDIYEAHEMAMNKYCNDDYPGYKNGLKRY
tara:strand:+ start:10059 stop:10595 length:537 start_codon:yes stop_codon:yes gene_type:complete